MPTVKYKCGDTGKMKTQKFPYNAMGIPQAVEFYNLNKKMGATIKMNPGKGKTEMGY